MNCRACDQPDQFRRFTAREMMFGWRHAFEYAECLACGTIQIVTTPPNLSDYYPADYYSLSVAPAPPRPASFVRRIFARCLMHGPAAGWLTRRLSLRYPFFGWARASRASVHSAILDVGCGSGRLLRRMQRSGFTNLQGVDPYAPGDIAEPGFRLRRAELQSVEGRFDLIILSHVLEHLSDPVATLAMARRRLSADGTILARVPVAGSQLAREYGPDWFQSRSAPPSRSSKRAGNALHRRTRRTACRPPRIRQHRGVILDERELPAGHSHATGSQTAPR